MTLDRTIRAILARGHVRLSADETAALLAAPPDHLLAAKLLAAHAFNTGDHGRAVAIARRVATLDPTAENEQNLVSALLRAGALAEALTRVEDPGSPLPPVLRATRAAELHARAGNAAPARRWGRRALALKDDEAGPAPDPRPETVLHAFDPAGPKRNVIAFSLFGTGARYVEGAIRNATVAPHLYPGWTTRFYIDDTVPEEVRRRLSRLGAQLRRVSGMPAARFGLYWRFLVEDDPEVAVYIVRDADSVLNIKERVAVQQWLDSRLPFHVMRDAPSHCELVLAGMWGAHRGNIGAMAERILAFDRTRAGVLNSRVDDQLFLRRAVWPLMRGRVCVHDPVFGHGATHAVPAGFDLPGGMHIGQNHFAARAP